MGGVVDQGSPQETCKWGNKVACFVNIIGNIQQEARMDGAKWFEGFDAKEAWAPGHEEFRC